MTNNLLDKVTTREAARTAAAEVEYRALLARSAAPEPGDDEKLEEAMRTLGRTPADVAADLRALAQETSLRDQVVGAARLAELADKAARLREEARRTLRDVMHAAIDKAADHELPTVFRAVSSVASCGKPTDYGDTVFAGARTAEMEADNARARNAELAAKLDALRAEHPLAFGTKARRPAPVATA